MSTNINGFHRNKNGKMHQICKIYRKPQWFQILVILVNINNILQNDMLNATLKPLSKKFF